MARAARQFGPYLRELRTRAVRPMTQRELAEKAGIWPTHVSEIERGLRPCGPHVAVRLTQALGINDEQVNDFVVRAAETTKRGSVWINPKSDYMFELMAIKLENAGVQFRKVVSVSPVQNRPAEILVVQSDGRAFYVDINVREGQAK